MPFQWHCGLVPDTADSTDDMIAKFLNWLLNGITPAQVDGLLYCAILVTSANMGVLTSDEVWKYVHPQIVFFVKWANILFNALVTGLKTFRSTAYGEQLRERLSNAETTKT